MRRLAAAGAAAAITALCVLGLTSGVAGAEAPDVQGWWTVSNPGSPVPTPPAPPDVPSNGLLVEGGPTAGSPTAYAGLLYVLTSTAVPSTLTLQITPSSGTTPDTTLELCPLKRPSLQPEQGGPMSDAPAYDCSIHVTAKPTSKGDAYQFNVSTLTSTQHALAVAVLPTASTDRVVFSAPSAGSLAVAGAGGNGSTELPGSGTPSGQGSAAGSGSGTSGGTGATAAGGGPAPPNLSVPSTGATTITPSNTAPVVAPTAGAAPAAAPAAIPVAAASTEGAKRRVVVVVLLAAAAGAIAWASAGNAAVRSVARGLAAPAGGNQQGSA